MPPWVGVLILSAIIVAVLVGLVVMVLTAPQVIGQ